MRPFISQNVYLERRLHALLPFEDTFFRGARKLVSCYLKESSVFTDRLSNLISITNAIVEEVLLGVLVWSRDTTKRSLLLFLHITICSTFINSATNVSPFSGVLASLPFSSCGIYNNKSCSPLSVMWMGRRFRHITYKIYGSSKLYCKIC